MKKLILNPISMFVSGLLLGVVSRLLDIYTQNHIFEPPYDGAKDMLLVENVDDAEYLIGLFHAIYNELPTPKKNK